MSTRLRLAPMALALLVFAGGAGADGDSQKVRALERQIEALQARVAALESRWTFTFFMPNFSERFHVMHRAGDAGDWAVASHELQEMKRMAAQSATIDAKNGKLMQDMMRASLESLEKAVEHGNAAKFDKALTQAVAACNACHAATGSSAIQVTLDVTDTMSMRHPHSLVRRPVPEGHTHEMPAHGSGMMHNAPADRGGHDDTGKEPHTH